MNSSFLRFLAGGIMTAGAFVFSACGEEHKSIGESGVGRWTHNAGRDCSGCHDAKYAGTVYQSSAGDVVPNAVVVITENDGTVVEITADNSGNFYTTRGNPSAGYSVTIRGNTAGMVSKPTKGGCSSSGCHDTISAPRVYVN